MYRHPVLLAIASLVLVPLPSLAQKNDVCGRIIDHGLNNISMRTSSYALADRVYWEFCDEKYENLSESKKKEFGVTIKTIPFSATDAKTSDREQYSKFCGKYKTSTDINSEQALLTSRMHDRAIDAWQQCVATVNSGMFIDFRIPANQKYADIFMKYTGSAGKTKFRGIESTGFTCKSNGKPVGPGTIIVITPAETALRCERQSITQNIGGVTSDFFPDGGITVKTDPGNASTEFVAMVDGPANSRFKQVDTQIAGVRTDLMRLTNHLQSWSLTDESRGNKVGGGDASGTTTCPAGQYAVGFQYWGAPRGTKYCIGCASGFQVVCRPLNGVVDQSIGTTAAADR